MALTDKQKRFAEEYIVDANARQAAIRAGYSRKTARQIGPENLSKPAVRSYIDELMEAQQSAKVATAQEVLEYLTSVIRGEAVSEEIVVEGCGEGISEARAVDKRPSEKDKLKAADLLGKRYGLYTEKVDVNIENPVVIQGYDDIED